MIVIKLQAFYFRSVVRSDRKRVFHYIMEVTVMQAKRKSADEQYELIMECRNSDLSDYQ
jgi:hypothetical protein